ncbi:MAG TPA: hypothetical protein VMC07_00820 [Candidatus Omnitrophota bacterium]|nr:hypothetical protein [Candidatus Omnitrophota bacterium]
MVIFKRKDKVLDWRYKGQGQQSSGTGGMGRMIQPRKRISEPVTVGDIGFLGDMAASNSSYNSEDNEDSGEKKKKLAKRILEMTDRIEDLSNQVYHLQQRIDLLEKKTGRSFE